MYIIKGQNPKVFKSTDLWVSLRIINPKSRMGHGMGQQRKLPKTTEKENARKLHEYTVSGRFYWSE